MQKLVEKLPDVRVTAYDGCVGGPVNAATTININGPAALAQILRAPRGLGLARACLTGQIEVQGDWYSVIRREAQLRHPGLVFALFSSALRAVPSLRLTDLRSTGPTPIECTRRRTGTHTIDRDTEELEFHYNLSVEFYRHLLGPSLTYSCGIFSPSASTLEEAQDNKHRMICEKLELDASATILDIGCGWGSFMTFATSNYKCKAIGITASRVQFSEVQRAQAARGNPLIRVIRGDYRQSLPLVGVTAAASIGMYEHVGEKNSLAFFALVHRCLTPGSLYLNQAIVMREGGPRRFRRNAFARRYIFPNAQLIPLSRQLDHLRASDFSIRSVERYGDSYALTIREWLRNLEANWEACARLVGSQRVMALYIYLMGSMAKFESEAVDLVQILVEAK